MNAFEWNDAYSVGVAAMDSQHKRLVEMVNRIYTAMRNAKGDQVVGQILKELANYTLTHFAAEETLMRKVGFPRLAEHIEKHKTLVEKASEMLSAMEAGKMIATVSLAAFLKDWLIQHIQNEDRQYGLFINTQISTQN